MDKPEAFLVLSMACILFLLLFCSFFDFLLLSASIFPMTGKSKTKFSVLFLLWTFDEPIHVIRKRNERWSRVMLAGIVNSTRYFHQLWPKSSHTESWSLKWPLLCLLLISALGHTVAYKQFPFGPVPISHQETKISPSVSLRVIWFIWCGRWRYKNPEHVS